MSLEAVALRPVIPRRLPCLPDHEQGWPAQGEWAYEDYERLPDDGRRYEIIEGVVYVTAGPSFDHQYTVGEVFRTADLRPGTSAGCRYQRAVRGTSAGHRLASFHILGSSLTGIQ